MAKENLKAKDGGRDGLNGYYVKRVGQNKGAPRIWLEGALASSGGFIPGTRFDIEIQGKTIVLQANPDGTRIVSGKQIGERMNPIIDLNSKELLAIFDGMAAVRVGVKDGEIFISPLASELRKQERYTRLKNKLESGEPLTIGSLSHGVGVLSHAFHTGLAAAGIQSTQVFANEIRPELLEHAREHNDVWSANTKTFAAPMEELAFDAEGLNSIPLCDAIELGLPCSAASPAGMSRLGLSMPEEHPEVGHLVVAGLIILAKANPAIVLVENVPAWSKSASAAIFRTQMKNLGYDLHERVMNGAEWGSYENRNRWCMVAVTHGIKFDFDQLVPPAPVEKRLGDILENVPDDDPRWSKMQGLRDKEVRDAANGNSFKMQIYDADSPHVNTVTKGYARVRSSDPKISNANDPDMLRQITPAEHAAIKQIPPHLVEGLSNTVKHEALGQSVIYEVFKDVGHHVGNSINEFAGRDIVPLHNRAQSLPGADLLSAEGAEMAADILLQLKSADSNHGRYFGRVVVADGATIVQDAGRGVGVVHQLDLLSGVPNLGEAVDVLYSQGKARLIDIPNADNFRSAGR